MTELEEKLIELANYYYEGNPQISDEEYDALVKKLKKENPNSELFNKVVGTDVKGIDKKYKLPITMGTLDKCNSEEEMKSWWNKHPNNDLVASLKIDGNGAVLTYKDGKFVCAYSRGDGEYGQDYTDKILKISDIPTTLKDNFSGHIRGEIYMLRTVWEKNFKDQKNPRNTAAGILGKKDVEDCKYLNFIAYEVFDDENKVDKTEVDKFTFLMSNGFRVPEWYAKVTLDQLIDWKNKIDPNDLIPCDGIVIRQNKVDKEDLMRKVPLNACALKPELQVGITTLIDIEWSMKGRYISPVAILEPVELEGTTVQRASLSNLNIMRELNVGIGDSVFVEKRGLIIPKIIKVAEHKTKLLNWKTPTVCPVCGTKLVENDSGILECVNEECSRKIAHRLKKFSKIFDIKYIGESFVEKIEKAEITFEDFIKMASGNNKEVFNKYSGGVNGVKIYEQIKNIFNTPISAAQFLATFDAPMLDEKRFLLFGEKTLDELINLSNDREKIISFKGIGDEIADVYINFFKNNIQEINSLRQYFTFKNVNDIIKTENNGGKKMSKIAGKSFCFTGKACKPRKELQEIVVKNGGINKDSVVKGLDYLVTDDTESGSAKNKKAKELGIPVISSVDFLVMAAN